MLASEEHVWCLHSKDYMSPFSIYGEMQDKTVLHSFWDRRYRLSTLDVSATIVEGRMLDIRGGVFLEESTYSS